MGIELKPNFSTMEISGKCLKCIAEGEFKSCAWELLRGREGEELKERFESLRSFLTSPELKGLRDKTEKLLSEGKEVMVRIYGEERELKYEMKVS